MSTYTKVSVDRRIGKKAANAFNLTGKRYGRVQVFAQCENIGSNSGWICFCDCGTWKKIRGVSLVKGTTSSCGCLHRERTGDVARTHGLSDSPEYQAWNHAKERCYNPGTWNYAKYGGRGITMCDEWKNSFESFFQYLGFKPSPQHSLDRWPNRDGNYEPGNCRWATPKEQSRNRDYALFYTFNGKTLTLKDWAVELGHPYKDLHKRIHFRGWSIEKAFTTPKKKWRGK